MYNKEELKEDIKKIGIKRDDTLLIHSSMKSIGEVEGGADTVLDAFMEYMKDGLLIFPTHSWAKINQDGDLYDPETEPSCVGILSNLFMRRPNVIRSLHPTHSVSAIGKNVMEYITGEEKSITPAPWTGCWGRLYNLGAKILFLGCSLNKNTFIHSVEEWCDIPNRLSQDTIKLKIKTGSNKIVEVHMLTHQAPVNDISKNYGKLKRPLLEKNIAVEGKIGKAVCYLCDVKDMADLTKLLLEKNCDYFLT